MTDNVAYLIVEECKMIFKRKLSFKHSVLFLIKSADKISKTLFDYFNNDKLISNQSMMVKLVLFLNL